jgi:hypothetical protein
MTEESLELQVRFPEATAADAGRLAQGLVEHLRSQASDCRAELRREDPSTMDAGTLVYLIVGTPAVLALARGIASYITKRATTITLEKDGRAYASGDGVEHLAAAIAAAGKKERVPGSKGR